MKRAAGFTLIEVVCALAIIALVAALVLPAIAASAGSLRQIASAARRCGAL
jgi:prepilin-type N-terminal cleavage/methylation domain-containing protein